MDTDRNLLFAVLALQADLLDREHFVVACTRWAARKDSPIAELLVEEGWLTADGRKLVDQLLAFKLDRHQGDVRASLAAALGSEARAALSTIADLDVRQSSAPLTPAGPLDFLRERHSEHEATACSDARATLPMGEGAGRNLLYEEIGRGGMGRVLRGRDPELGRDLAVKVLHERFKDDPQVQRRFVEEAQVGGQLQHPGVVPVYELGRFPDRRPYFTMKLVKGQTLAELLHERIDPGHDLPRCLTIFEQVCQTVAYAHSHGVIHRDLKPANIMVGAFGEVQVMDWGLAKVLGNRSADAQATTTGTLIQTVRSGSTAEDDQTGVVGTPAFVAPEQARGEAVDERADVFGLGGILCEILTSQPPYLAPHGKDALAQAMAGDVAETFARLEKSSADQELVTLCKDCLAAQREDRPRDASVVAARVTGYQATVRERLRQAELKRAAAEARAEEERKRRRVQLALAGAVLALVGLTAGGGLWVERLAAERDRRDAAQRQMVETALDKAGVLGQQARWAEAAAVLEQADRVLGGAGPGDLRQRLEQAQAELALVKRLDAIQQRAASVIERRLDMRSLARDYAAAFEDAGLGTVGEDEATVAARLRTSAVSAALVAALDDWASAVEKSEPRAWLTAVARRADPHPWRDRLRDPAQWLNRPAQQALADEALRDDGARLDQLSPQALAALGRRLHGLGGNAVPLLRAAQQRHPSDFWLALELGNALDRTKLPDEVIGYYRVAVAVRPEAAVAHNNLGAVLHDKKEVDGAIAELKTAIALDPAFMPAHYNLGMALRDKGDLDGAITAARTAIALDPAFAPAHLNLGNALAARNNREAALAEYHKAIELDQSLARAYLGLGAALASQGDLEGAISQFRTAVDLAPTDAAAHYNLGIALYTKKDLDGAITAYRKAIALDAKLAFAHNNLGLALRDKADLDAAIVAFRQATELVPNYADAHSNLGGVLRDRGRFAEALTELRRGQELGRRRPGWPDPTGQWVRDCEHLMELESRLPAILAGEAEPAGTAEWLALAQLCQQHQRRHTAAARFYAGAFAIQPQIADDLSTGHRYNAACSALLAAAGDSRDAGTLPDKVRSGLRRQSLAWLQADLGGYARLANGPDPAARRFVKLRLAQWHQDADLASVRDLPALERLPEEERQQWRRLWDNLAVLLGKLQEKK
jgi:tetratricopeptide (TPR) repeat protein/tRNA A-37 threonylcarbamoyl transferase component Bud32